MPTRTDSSRGTDETGADERQTAEHPPLWEQAIAAVAALLVAGLMGYLVWQVLTHKDTLPAVAFRTVAIEAQASGYLVRFEASNQGDVTASGVEIAGLLTRDGATIEASHVVIDYLPGRSVARGGLWFTQDPRQGELALRALGYVDP
jgi:uncharacterized protein (TIGR02588 family)